MVDIFHEEGFQLVEAAMGVEIIVQSQLHDLSLQAVVPIGGEMGGSNGQGSNSSRSNLDSKR